MLTDKDKLLIEKYLDSKLNPDSPALTSQEEIIFNERIQDPDFQKHLKLSDEVNKAITNDDEIKFIKTLEKVANDYHKR